MKKHYHLLKKRWLWASLLLAFSATQVNAQLNYTRATFTGTYTPISVGSGATLSTAAGDGVVQTAIPIGFTFNYNGVPYTTITASTDGWASFTQTTSSLTNNNLFSTTAPNTVLAPYWDDLNTNAVGTNPAGSILYQTQGTPGSQTFTIQWTNVSSFFSATNGQPAGLNFQVILYEGSDMIEFRYGTVNGVSVNTSESASIGIENQTGGPGNFIDAVTGSSNISNAMITSNKWPSKFFRFTPGSPTPLAGGTYTIGASQTFPNITEALAEINHRGITGPVTLSLTDAVYDATPANGKNTFPLLLGPVAGSSSTNTITIQPASGTSTITWEGSTAGNIANSGSTTAFSSSSEPVLGLIGTDYVTLNNLILNTTGAGVVDRGLQISNVSATDGAGNNTINNLTVVLSRTNTNSRGIVQTAVTTPTALTGVNGFNKYYNINISNVYSGILLTGNGTFPDPGTEIGTFGLGTTVIGANTPDDIGNGTSAVFGIRATSQSGIKIFNTTIRNLTTATNTSTTTDVDGIYLDLGQDNSEIHNNWIYNLKGQSSSATPEVTGIRSNLATTSTGHSVKVYNNFIFNLTSGYTSATLSANRQIKGIFVQSNGSGGGNTQNIDFNSVAIDNSVAPNVSSTAFEIGTTSGPVINVRNNIFANYTGAQTGAAGHYAWVSTSGTLIGPAGSVSDYNDLYIDDAANGYVGRGSTTTFATLANWQTGMSSDANSISSDPGFVDINSDLHASGTAVNGMANMTGITWVTTDIDNQVRNAPHDIGADDYTPASIDLGVIALVSPVAAGCHTGTENVIVTIQNFAAGAIDFSVTPATVTVTVSGAASQTYTVTLNNNSLNSGNPLASGATLNVTMGTLLMNTTGTYTFNGATTVAGDAISANDAMNAESITISAGTAASSSGSVCAGSSVTLSATNYTGTIQWQSYDAATSSWVNETGAGNTSASYTVIPTDTTEYRILVCGTYPSNSVIVDYIDAQPPVVSNVSRCGTGPVTMAATGPGTINWYTTSTGGAPVFTGSTYAPTLSSTTTYYVETSIGGGSENFGETNQGTSSFITTAAGWGLFFTANNNFTLNSVTVYPTGTGTITIHITDLANTILASSAPFSLSGSGTTPVIVPVNLPISAGNYKIGMSYTGITNLVRKSGSSTFPYTSPSGVVSITAGANGGTSSTTSSYYWFFDWNITTGCVSSRAPVTATINPVPVVNLGNDTVFCQSTTPLTLDATNAGSTYSWSTAATTPTIAVSSTGTYSVTVTNAQSCVATDAINIVVNPLPVISLGSDVTQCGGTVLLDANNPGPGFAWSNGDATQTTVVSSTGNYDVAVTDGNGCVGRDTVLVTINPNPVVNLGADSSFCTGGSIVLDAGNTGMNYTWSTGANTQTISVNAADTFAVTVVDTSTGCSGVDTVVTSLDALPVVSLGADITQCGGTAMLDAGNAGSSFVWSTSASTQTIAVSSTGSYIATVTNAAGCSQSDTINVTIDPVPVVNLGSDLSQCGGTIMLTAGNPGATYQWSHGPTSQVVTINTTGNYSVVVTNAQNCSNSDTVQININPNPLPNAGNDTIICAGSTITLNGGSGYASYTWSVGSFTSSTQTITVSPGTTTSYALSVTDTNGCTSVNADTVVVSVEQTTPGFSSSVASGNVVSFVNTTISGLPFTSSWDFGDGNTASTTNASHTYTANGTYTVALTISNACGSYTVLQQVVVTGVGVEEVSVLKDIKVYPNPSEGIFSLEISNIDIDKLNVDVMDITGRVIFTSVEEAKGGLSKTIDLSSFAKGVYYLRLQSGSSSETRRIVIQ